MTRPANLLGQRPGAAQPVWGLMAPAQVPVQAPAPGQYVSIGKPPPAFSSGEIIVMNPVSQESASVYSAAGCKATKLQVASLGTVKVSCASEASFTVHLRTRLPDGIVLVRQQTLATGAAYFIGVDKAHAYVLNKWTSSPAPMPPPASPL